MPRAHEVAIGKYAQRGMAYEATRLSTIPRNVSAWQSVFAFDMDELISFLDEHGAMNGSYPGEVFLPRTLPLDFDGEKARKDVLWLLNDIRRRCSELGLVLADNSLAVFLSGGKGYHVWLPTAMFAASCTPANIKDTLKLHFGHLESLDLTMYNKAGLIRVPWSVHQKTGKQVVRISISSLVACEESSLSYGDTYSFAERKKQTDPIIGYNAAPLYAVGRPVLERTRTKVRGSHNMTNRISCMQKMTSEPVPAGHRHEYVLRGASWMRRLGISQEFAEAGIALWTGEREWSDTVSAIEDVYSNSLEYGCHDHVMDQFCSKSCIFYNQKIGMKPEVKTFEDQFSALLEFRRKIAEGRGINLKAMYPWSEILEEDYWILPGECAIFTGDTGMGKSALVQGIIHEAGNRTLYMNLENSEELMTRRFIQIAMGGARKEEVNRLIESGRLDPEILASLRHVLQVTTSPTIGDIAAMVKDVQPEVLVIDTTDVIEVPEAGNNEMWQLKRIIEEMRKLAARFDIIVLAIHHINKRSSVENKIDLNSLTGNRANVTRMDHVFSITGVRELKKRKFATLKSRDGDPFNVPVMFDGAKMKFYPMLVVTPDVLDETYQEEDTDLFNPDEDGDDKF